MLSQLPELTGCGICIYDRPQLKAHGTKLLSGPSERGVPVYAAAFLRRREIMLRTELLAQPNFFRFILVHELFHFVWLRLGNRRRAEFADLIRCERACRSRGELGESSALKRECLPGNSNAWRDYLCEAFCDTAAWLYSGVRRHSAFTLAKRWRHRRIAWFEAAFRAGARC